MSLDAVDGFFTVVIRDIVSEFVHDHVAAPFSAAEAVLHRSAARVQRACRYSRNEYRGAQGNLRGAFMADVISSSTIGTLPVYVSHAGRSNPQ